MTGRRNFDVIVVGGSYAGLASALALGRALRTVLIIDSGKPCNRQTPFSHNFLTRDGSPPKEIAALARQQVENYETISFISGLAISAVKSKDGFRVITDGGETFSAKKVIFATGIKDIMSPIDGYAECWGISVLHCPYCHGYEVRDERTGILGNGEWAFEFSSLISNWTRDLTVFTNGPSALTAEQTRSIGRHNIKVVEKKIERLDHTNGFLQHVIFQDGTTAAVKALYARSPFEQHSGLPETLGCELTDDGYIRIDASQKTTVPGVFACGDNTTRMRTVANAVAMGTSAGITVSREIIAEEFFHGHLIEA